MKARDFIREIHKIGFKPQGAACGNTFRYESDHFCIFFGKSCSGVAYSRAVLINTGGTRYSYSGNWKQNVDILGEHYADWEDLLKHTQNWTNYVRSTN